MSWKSTKHSAIILLIFTTLVLQSCATYRIQAENGGLHNHSSTMWSLAWGLAQPQNPILKCEECTKQPLAVVDVKNNFGFALITVLTLGFASPITLEWKHTQPNPEPGDVP